MPRKRKKKTAAKRKKTYKHPIPSRNELLDYLEAAGKPVKAEPILAGFGLKGQRMRALLVERLQGMVRAGQIIAQIDTRTLQQELNQAQADLENQRIRLDVSETQYNRAVELQTEAAKASNNDAEYVARLERFKQAAAEAREKQQDASSRK